MVRRSTNSHELKVAAHPHRIEVLDAEARPYLERVREAAERLSDRRYYWWLPSRPWPPVIIFAFQIEQHRDAFAAGLAGSLPIAALAQPQRLRGASGEDRRGRVGLRACPATIVVAGTKVRLNGLHAPEPHEPGGREATDWMIRATAGQVLGMAKRDDDWLLAELRRIGGTMRAPKAKGLPDTPPAEPPPPEQPGSNPPTQGEPNGTRRG